MKSDLEKVTKQEPNQYCDVVDQPLRAEIASLMIRATNDHSIQFHGYNMRYGFITRTLDWNF